MLRTSSGLYFTIIFLPSQFGIWKQLVICSAVQLVLSPLWVVIWSVEQLKISLQMLVMSLELLVSLSQLVLSPPGVVLI